MQLKPRSKPSGYECFENDIHLLQQKHSEYESYFVKNNTLWPVEKYHSERNRIILEWHNKTAAYATWTKEVELSELDIAFNATKTKEVVERVIISTLFGKTYAYFPNMVSDNEIGYLPDESFADNLFKYNEAIEMNKKLKLNCWKKTSVEQIEKAILRIAQSIINHK